MITKEIAQDNFPLELSKSKFKPKRLFYVGTLPSSTSIGIAMVGTRRPSNNARELCMRMVKSLKGTNAVIVSGLAQGIDSFCHEAALEFGIPTLAVIAQGLDAQIPGERAVLAKRIIDSKGAIISEYEGATPAFKGSFPARNRIISGLCKATIIVQSKIKGGAIKTAEYCLKESKLLLAVPGDFDSEVASGPNNFLDQGKAKPIFLPESLRTCVGLSITKQAVNSVNKIVATGCNISKDAIELFKRFNGFKKTIHEINEECNFKTENILAILTELELSGLVQTSDNYQFYFNGTT